MTNKESLIIPSYSKLGRRKLVRQGQDDDLDLAYTNIRKKLSTSIQVPYKKGLGTLFSFPANNHGSGIARDAASRADSVFSDKRFHAKKAPESRDNVLSSGGDSDLKPVEDKKGKFQNAKVIKASECAVKPFVLEEKTFVLPEVQSFHRPLSYSSSWGTESLWSDRIEEIKSRYSENSEFLCSVSKLGESPFIDKNKQPHKDNPLSEDSGRTSSKKSNSKKAKVRKPSQSSSIDEELDKKGRKSNLSDHSQFSNGRSVVESPTKLPPVSTMSEYSDASKTRKVEFNLQPRTSSFIKFPEIPSTSSFTSPSAMANPKSILKRGHLSALPITWSPQYAKENDQPTTSSGWQPYLPVIQSPDPFDKGKKQKQHGLLFKCSKEFETVAIDIDAQEYVT